MLFIAIWILFMIKMFYASCLIKKRKQALYKVKSADFEQQHLDLCYFQNQLFSLTLKVFICREQHFLKVPFGISQQKTSDWSAYQLD